MPFVAARPPVELFASTVGVRGRTLCGHEVWTIVVDELLDAKFEEPLLQFRVAIVVMVVIDAVSVLHELRDALFKKRGGMSIRIVNMATIALVHRADAGPAGVLPQFGERHRGTNWTHFQSPAAGLVSSDTHTRPSSQKASTFLVLASVPPVA